MKPGLLGEMADARAGEGRHKISLKSFCTRKEESTQRMMGCDQKKKKKKDTGARSKPLSLAKSGTI